ncbi:uncharacterized protein LOC132751023 isoform X2 [Ruditapes philippinarum]|uniref:uncharacterized protein LOC132751023 isoform X2 n=1 Tax=Ruditapes philippinarum TaxID=129788 RepID=UPI00295BAC65|nr:uncharacterized protein LOC132751023 isoform X2 [Ruditapes philippinarum]
MEDSREESLEDGWEKRYDTIHGRVFYVHPKKRLAQLEDPKESGVQTKKYGKDWINVIEADAPLDDFPWFHGNISYAKSEKLLKYQENGTFLVRRSQSHPDWLVLVVKRPTLGKQALQFQIKYTNPGEYFQIERDDNIFFSIPKLIEYYTNHTILNFGIKLTAPLDKHEMNETKSNVPDELSNDPKTRELYEKALEKGTENDNTIRVMVIGCCEQGKTSLVRRLLKKSVEGVETTNGIDLHKCTVISENEWKKLDNEDLDEETVQRLVNIALRERTYETFASVTHGEKGLLNKDEEAPTSVTDISRTRDKNKICSARGLEIIDISDEYNGKRRENVKENKTKIAGAVDIYVRNKTVNYENLNSFQTELKRVESIEAAINLDNNVTLNIWDFGGQFVYYATHQIFHSKHAVYVLVFNLSISLDTIIEDKEFPLHQKRMRDYLKFWVASVNSFVGSRDGMEPAIILVGTHTDKLNMDSKVEDYFEEVRQIFDDSVCLNHIQPDQFAISNTSESESEIDALRSYITRLGKIQMKTRIPAKWILLEKALKMNKHKRIIKLDELIEIDSLNRHYPKQQQQQLQGETRIYWYTTEE